MLVVLFITTSSPLHRYRRDFFFVYIQLHIPLRTILSSRLILWRRIVSSHHWAENIEAGILQPKNDLATQHFESPTYEIKSVEKLEKKQGINLDICRCLYFTTFRIIDDWHKMNHLKQSWSKVFNCQSTIKNHNLFYSIEISIEHTFRSLSLAH